MKQSVLKVVHDILISGCPRYGKSESVEPGRYCNEDVPFERNEGLVTIRIKHGKESLITYQAYRHDHHAETKAMDRKWYVAQFTPGLAVDERQQEDEVGWNGNQSGEQVQQSEIDREDVPSLQQLTRRIKHIADRGVSQRWQKRGVEENN